MFILTLMIKNEEKIILRCIQSTLSLVDAILISDTGSTDNTLSVLNDFFSTLSIPTKIVHDPWVNFEVNRTNSFTSTVEWAKEQGWEGYSLVMDADMILHVNNVDKTIQEPGYMLLQKNKTLEYPNVRLMKLSHPWKCVGVTHEYWQGPTTTLLDWMYIEDKEDGGCKEDKFIRDERLLSEGLRQTPTNARYMFYYAQTLRDLNRTEEAIEWYKKRAECGGWVEEVWYSMYQISRLYAILDKLPEMEYWSLKAYEVLPTRSENIYVVLKKFREKKYYFKAWYYYKLGLGMPKPDGLFVQPDVYTHLFPYEGIILAYYVFPSKNFLYDFVCYVNTYNDLIWNNLTFYVSRIPSFHTRRLYYPLLGEYTPSSISVLKMNTQYLLNVRYVDYRLFEDGSYKYKSGTNAPHTRNFKVITDSHFIPTSPMVEMEFDDIDVYGVEDVKLFTWGDTIKWIGTSPDYPRIHMVYGTYNIETHRLEDRRKLISPTQHEWEKNWIPIDHLCIYKWHPYTVGRIQENEFKTEFTQETPLLFSRVKGSSTAVRYKESYYAITHMIVGDEPRKYYHMLIKINASYKIEGYTLPFYFVNHGVEFCLGIDITEDILSIFISINDMDPTLLEVDMNELEFISVD